MQRFVLDENGSMYVENVVQEILTGDFKKALIGDELKNNLSLSPVITSFKNNDVLTGSLRFVVSGVGSCNYATVRLKVLNFNSAWDVVNVQGTDVLQPVLINGNESSAINPLEANQNLLWKIPDEFPTFLVFDWRTMDMLMVTFDVSKNYKLCRLPVPNYFADTRLCFKLPENVASTLPDKSILERVQTMYDGWVNSIWNRDLYTTRFTDVFCWTPEGDQQWRDTGLYVDYPEGNFPKEYERVYQLIKGSVGGDEHGPVI